MNSPLVCHPSVSSLELSYPVVGVSMLGAVRNELLIGRQTYICIAVQSLPSPDVKSELTCEEIRHYISCALEGESSLRLWMILKGLDKIYDVECARILWVDAMIQQLLKEPQYAYKDTTQRVL